MNTYINPPRQLKHKERKAIEELARLIESKERKARKQGLSFRGRDSISDLNSENARVDHGENLTPLAHRGIH